MKHYILGTICIVLVMFHVGCAAHEPVQKEMPQRITLSDNYRPELWVVGGMGSFVKKPSELYVAKALAEKIIGISPDVCVTSLTMETGPNSIIRNLISTPAWLDEDAWHRAHWALTMFVNPKKSKGHFVRHDRTTKIRIILVAPCTQIPPPKTPENVDLKILVLRDPSDKVPNQSIFVRNDPEYFKKFGKLMVVESRPDMKKSLFGVIKPGGIQGGHHFTGYWKPDLKVLKKEERFLGHEWVDSGKRVNLVKILEGYLNDSSIDFIFIGHSQGANIIMQMLKIGLDAPKARKHPVGLSEKEAPR